MTTSRVLILYDQEMFGQGVHALIKTRSDLQVVAVEPFGDDTVRRATDLQPNIVILSENADRQNLLPDLLEAIPGVRVVRLTLDDNIVRVYDCHRIVAGGTEDLMAALDFARLATSTGPTP